MSDSQPRRAETVVDPRKARRFARDVVERLQRAGFTAYWAGGCVRDQLLGREPQDYDVATNATPDQVREVLGRRRTIPVGESFGVITVVGPPGAGQVEVATFRQDEGYSDGRHPDRVRFSSPAEDAQRRDFTINGLFYDPVRDEVIDYVGGQEDLARGVIRAIGEPQARFAEDKLRMLRAVRFATTLGFTIDPATLDAIRLHAHRLDQVSGERIGMEMRKLLEHPSRAAGLRLLESSRLWEVVLPEYARLTEPPRTRLWAEALHLAERLGRSSFPVALAAVLWPLVTYRTENTSDPRQTIERMVAQIAGRWKLSNAETRRTTWILTSLPQMLHADRLTWSQLQPVLAHAFARDALPLAEAVASVTGSTGPAVCREKLKLPPDQLNPPPLVDGHALQKAGIPPGPLLGRILRTVRGAQLDGRVQTPDEALALARRLYVQQQKKAEAP